MERYRRTNDKVWFGTHFMIIMLSNTVVSGFENWGSLTFRLWEKLGLKILFCYVLIQLLNGIYTLIKKVYERKDYMLIFSEVYLSCLKQ